MAEFAVYETPAGAPTRFIGNLDADDLADAIHQGKRCGSVPLGDDFSLDALLVGREHLIEQDDDTTYCAIEIAPSRFRPRLDPQKDCPAKCAEVHYKVHMQPE